MRRLDTITGGADRLRIGPWRGDPAVALLSPTPGIAPTPSGSPGPSTSSAAAATGRSSPRHWPRASSRPSWPPASPCTSACTCSATTSGGCPRRRVAGARLRRGRNRDIPAVLEVDGLAFDRFWRFDTTGLADARTATPHARFRVATIGGEVVGYHVTGRAGTLGYLQRLAVHPDRHGHGIGTALVGDSLDWCHRKGCRSVLVNTQEANQRALSLYEHLGFRSEPTGLAVLERPLDDGPAG